MYRAEPATAEPPPPRHVLTRWPKAWHLIAVDAIGAIVLMFVYVGFSSGGTSLPGYRGPYWIALVLSAVIGLPVAFRRKWPLPVLAVVVAASTVATAVGITREPYIATVFVLYMVALAETRARSLTALVAAVAAGGLALLSQPMTGNGTWDVAVQVIVFLVVAQTIAWALGHITRRMRLSEMRGERERTDKAIVDERLRIAREMHDVVAHSLSVIAVKAGVAGHVAEQHPDEARKALAVIETVSRGSLSEMRRMLGVLRSGPGGPDGAEDAVLVPAPSLKELPELAERARQAGVGVRLEVSDVDELPDGVSLAVYRIVQEALTNVVKHAAPADCRVLVAAAYGEVRVEVVDDGPGHRVVPERFSGEPGHGLAGMRERVMMYGGEFEAGPRAGGGFAVRARIPYGDGVPAVDAAAEEEGERE